MLQNLLQSLIGPARRIGRAGVMTAIAILCMSCLAQTPRPSASAGPDDGVERTLAGLDLRHKIGQLLFPRVSGSYMPVGSAEYERVRGWIQDLGVGGLIETLGPPMEAAAKLNMLQQLAAVPLLITADMEDGPGQLMNGGAVFPWGLRNGGGTRFPPAMGIGAADDEALARDMGRITALEARAIGVHMNFAPVVDVNNNPANPIINTRSYGADPRLVARLAAAAMRGMQENGLLATAKHFPGHGDTETDSHIELPVITVDRTRADSIELLPYRALIQGGVSGVMSAHIAFPAMAGDSVPATLNPDLLGSLLRDQLSFHNLIVTDALDMGAIVRGYGATEAPILALEAGADMLLQPFPQDVPGVIDAIERAVRSGRLTEARIDASVRRILAAKARLGLHRARTVDLAGVANVVGSPGHTAGAGLGRRRTHRRRDARQGRGLSRQPRRHRHRRVHRACL
jgi:beta-N-acetylhexosaminidase